MFDLSLAHITLAERERDLVAELRDRQVLKTASSQSAFAPVPARIDRPATQVRVAARGVGRQG